MPDRDGNLLEISDDIYNKFYSQNHKININLYKEYVKRYINQNFTNLTKEEIFNKEENNIYLKMYCSQYYLSNPDQSHDEALT